MSESFPSRKNPRIPGYDYSRPGYYFTTICTKNREELFSKIQNEVVCLTDLGRLVQNEWIRSESIRKEIELDAFVIMPNHIHAIVHILEWSGRSHRLGLEKGSLSSLITGFKSSVTKKARLAGLSPESPWQRGFFEHIIREEAELYRIREYIANNPLRWSLDQDNLNALVKRMQFANGFEGILSATDLRSKPGMG